MAQVNDVRVLACRIAGAPPDAAARLQLSPEAHIPMAVTEAGLSFEFAPLLTIRNAWEHADLPSFTPMAQEIVVALDNFAPAETHDLTFSVSGQDVPLQVRLHFEPLT